MENKLTELIVSFCIVTFTVCFAAHSLAQTTIEPNYFTELTQRETALQNLELTMSEEDQSREGGARATHELWKSTWGPRADAQGSFATYFENRRISLDALANSEVSVIADSPWEEMGPNDHPNSDLMTTVGGGDFGPGPIEFIRFYPNDPTIVLCGSTSGGLFYSSDNGGHWVNGGTDLKWEESGCGWAEFRSGYPDTWFAINAGQGSTGQESIGIGALWRTTDAGGSWEKLIPSPSIEFDFYSKVYKFAINSDNTNHLVVASQKGVYFSHNVNEPDVTDVGWDFTEYPLGAVDGRRNVYDIVHVPNKGFFATLSEDDFSNFTIIRSTDNGVTWTEIPNQPTELSQHEAVTLSVSAVDNNSITIFGVRESGDPDLETHNLYRLNAQSSSWLTMDVPSEVIFHGVGKAFCVSNLDIENIMLATNYYRLRYTSDGGSNWSFNDSFSGDLWHVDVEGITSHPTNPGEFWIATHGGVYRTTDGGLNFERHSTGLGVGQVWSLSSESKDGVGHTLIARYHGGSSHLSDIPNDWLTVQSGDGMVALISDMDPNHQYCSVQNASWTGTVDAWQALYPSTGFNDDGLGEWQANGEVSAFYPQTVFYCRASNELMRTTNGGLSGDYISEFETDLSVDPLVQGAGVTRIYSSSAAPGNLYAAVYVALVNGGHRMELMKTSISNSSIPSAIIDSWEKIALPASTSWSIAGISSDPENSEILYVAFGEGVYNSASSTTTNMVHRLNMSLDITDPGYSIDITGNLPPINSTGRGSNSLIFEKGSNNGLFLRSDNGVFYTNQNLLDNDPDPWKLFGAGLPHVSTYAINIDYGANKIRAGLAGRGAWEHDLYCPPDQTLALSGIVPTNEFYEVTDQITSSEFITNGADVNYRAGNEIILEDGFVVTEGTTWRAFIHGCDSPGNSFRMAGSDDVATENTELKSIAS